MLEGLRRTDDPGLERRLLGASNAIERPLYPRCLMARVCLAEAAVVALLCVLLWLVLVATP